MIKHPLFGIPYDTLYTELCDRVSEGRISRSDGSDELSAISIFNYTNKAVYDRLWDIYSLSARGLILDTVEKRIVALPFPKFFNYSENNYITPSGPFRAYEKFDGSLIILFFHAGKWHTATRGSFTGSRVDFANRFLRTDKRDIGLGYLDHNNTFLFEAIYPENRIVIAYPQSELVLLGGYCLTDYRELGSAYLNIIANRLDVRQSLHTHFESIYSLVSYVHSLPASQEGFVVQFLDPAVNGLRLKFKGAEYCRIHSLISRITPLGIFAVMRESDDIALIRRQIPEEFYHDFDAIVAILQSQYDAILLRLERLVR